MRVVMPYTRLEPEVVAALDASGFPWEAVDVSSDSQAYWRLLCDLWEGEDLALVEHDVVVNPGTLQAFGDCPEEWCAAPYEYMGRSYAGLGAVRFRAGLMRHYRGAAEMAGGHDYGEAHGRGHWCTLDHALTTELQRYRYARCLHAPVHHLGDGWPSHGCVRRAHQ